jgi:alpha-beta hydrolase superfamily lysophospholipase
MHMQHKSFSLSAKDSAGIFVNHWFGDQAPKAVIMIAHGMAEHSSRYARLADTLVSNGYAVFALDHRGHGQTSKGGVQGHFADQDGWKKVVGDLDSLNQHIRALHPQTPIILLGHSMGSYIGQAYLIAHSADVHAAIWSGSNFQPKTLYKAASYIARFERFRQGPTGLSALINFLSFGAFNKAFKPTRTEFDWLSRDPAEVDKYIADPLCGFLCTNQMWVDLLGGLQDISSVENLSKIRPAMPMMVLGGSRDPVSDGSRLNDLAKALQSNGRSQLTLKIYPEGRHEMFNETNRDAVTADVLAWLESAI